MVNKTHLARGVIFDLDGTLIHTTIDFAAMKSGVLRILVEAGVPRGALDPLRTTTENQLRGVAYLAGHGGDAEGALDRTSALMSDVEMHGVLATRPINSAAAAVAALRGMHLRVGVLTRGSRAYSTQALRSADLWHLIEWMVCRDDFPEEEAKPSSLALHRAAAGLGLKAEECIMVGDHLMDLECARAAGSAFAGVLTGSGDEALWRREGVRLIVADVGELPHLLCPGRQD